MTVRVSPYLSFGGNAREAMRYYRFVFGGSVQITTFADLHASTGAAQDELVAHAVLKGATGIMLMGSDRTPGDGAGGVASITLGGDNEAEISGYWERLCAGGTVTVPFARSPWGTRYGRCTDRFGTDWLVNLTTSTTPRGG